MSSLAITPLAQRLDTLENPAFYARRQQHMSFDASTAMELPAEGVAAGAHLEPFVERRQAHHGERDDRDEREDVEVLGDHGRERGVHRGPLGGEAIELEDQEDGRARRGDDREDGEREEEDEPARARAGLVLRGEEVHARQAKLTLGALRSVGSSILKSSAGWKPKAPAKITLGKTSRLVL